MKQLLKVGAMLLLTGAVITSCVKVDDFDALVTQVNDLENLVASNQSTLSTQITAAASAASAAQSTANAAQAAAGANASQLAEVVATTATLQALIDANRDLIDAGDASLQTQVDNAISLIGDNNSLLATIIEVESFSELTLQITHQTGVRDAAQADIDDLEAGLDSFIAGTYTFYNNETNRLFSDPDDDDNEVENLNWLTASNTLVAAVSGLENLQEIVDDAQAAVDNNQSNDANELLRLANALKAAQDAHTAYKDSVYDEAVEDWNAAVAKENELEAEITRLEGIRDTAQALLEKLIAERDALLTN